MKLGRLHLNHVLLPLGLFLMSFYPAHCQEEVKNPICELGKTVALTFDDGPSSVTTPRILSILKENGAKATFFVVGKSAQRSKQLMEQIIQDGHEVGNHSLTHPQLTRVSMATARNELSSTNQIIKDTTGSHPTWFRPPYGAVNRKIEAMASELGLKTIMWTEDPRDWSKRATPESIERIILKTLKPGSVVLLHDNHQATIQALPSLLEKMKERGYKFVTVSELKDEENNVRLAKANVCGKGGMAAL